MKMRFSLAVVVVLVGISVSGLAQQKIRVKRSPPDRTAKKMTAPMGKSAGVGTSSAANSKDLQALEHQTARSSVPRSTAKKTPGAAAVKPVQVKDKASPPINLGGGGGAKGSGLTRQNSNPYKGRLKQKYGR
jgi:hypothetical protein